MVSIIFDISIFKLANNIFKVDDPTYYTLSVANGQMVTDHESWIFGHTNLSELDADISTIISSSLCQLVFKLVLI